MSAFNVNMFSIHPPNAVLSKSIGRKGKQEESTTLVTNQHINLSVISLPPATSNGCKAYKARSEKRAGRLAGVGEAWRMSESYPTYCRFVSSKHNAIPHCSLKL
jgi:hypothetical protein